MLEDYTRIRKLYPISKKKEAKDGDNRNQKKGGEPGKSEKTGVMYQQEELVPGTNEKVHALIKCHRCNKFGHYLSPCPETKENQNVMIEEEQDPDNEKEQEGEGTNHMQLLETMKEID